jgi:hypothetical protein
MLASVELLTSTVLASMDSYCCLPYRMMLVHYTAVWLWLCCSSMQTRHGLALLHQSWH